MKTQELGQKDATGRRKRAVEGVVVASDGFGQLKYEVSMWVVGAIVIVVNI